MAETPGSQVLILSEELGISGGAAPNVDDQTVLYGPGIARGESTPSEGQDVLLITEGTAQTGPSSFLVDGEPIGFFETEETPEEFYDYGNAGDDGIQANAKGLKEFGMDDEPSIPTMYVWVFHSLDTDQYALGAWYYKEGESDTYATRLTIEGSNEHFPDPGNPLVKDDPEGVGTPEDDYGTDSDGNAISDHSVNSMENGDGAFWEMNTGVYELEFQYGPSDKSDAPRPDQVRFRGPDGNLEKPLSDSGSFTFTIAFS